MERPLFPVIIGVTGHRDIAPEAEQSIRASVRALLADWRFWFDPALYVLTALADGADQLVADEALALGIPIIAVAPMPLDKYRATLRDPARLDVYWHQAALTLVLPEVPEETWPGNYDDRHYEQLGVLVARRSHLLLALWDGTPDPTRCGTGAVVRMRLDGDHGAAAFRGSPMFIGANSLLGMTYRGPLLHVFTPRRTVTDDMSGTCTLLGVSERDASTGPSIASAQSSDNIQPGLPVDPGQVLNAIRGRKIRDFDFIRELNGQIASFPAVDRQIFRRQLDYLDVRGIPDAARRNADILKGLQAATDTAAQAFQIKLLGNFVPAHSPREMLANALKASRSRRQLPRMGAVFLFSLAVPLAVVLFEIYVHFHDSTTGTLALLLYLGLFGITAGFYEFRVSRENWQSRFQDYRALAEALRVQLYWAVSALPVAVSDHYLHKQSNELGWIQFALRGPALWSAAVVEILSAPIADTTTKGWIDDQRDFFNAKAQLLQHADRRGRTLTKALIYSSLVAAALLLLPHASILESASGGTMVWVLSVIESHHGLIVVLAAVLPAAAAFFSVSRELRAYEPLAHSYALMRHMFERAAAVAGKPNRNDAEFQDLVFELGREALAENAEWLVDHRHRKIEHRS